MSYLLEKRCQNCEGGTSPLSETEALNLLREIPGWSVTPDHTAITRAYVFKNYYQTMAFVNALAWISHQENHHPDLTVGYNRCEVLYTTHGIGGLSENDFICAARINQLY